MRTVVIIQARMGSTRLPGKVLMPIKGKTVLNHVVDRVKQARGVDDIVIATTHLPIDDVIVEESQYLEVHYFRGSENDVLSRYYLAAKEYRADVVIRITSDCPLIDPKVIDEMIDVYANHEFEIVTNVGRELSDRTFPRGLDIEMFSFQALEDAYLNANETYHREHVTPYLYETVDNINYFKNDLDYSNYRLTVDTEEDFLLVSTIYGYLYQGAHNFYLQDIIDLFEKQPELIAINAHIEQKKTN